MCVRVYASERRHSGRRVTIQSLRRCESYVVARLDSYSIFVQSEQSTTQHGPYARTVSTTTIHDAA